MNTQALERDTITVQRIMPAKGAGKSASIKDENGVFYGFWPDKLGGIIREGETYDIDFTAVEKNNVIYRDIRAARMATRPGPSPAQFTSGRDDRGRDDRAPAQSRPATAPATSSAPTSQGNGGGQYYRPTAPRDSERMFVCSTLNALIQTGRVECHRQVIADHINELRAGYAMTFGKDDPA